MLGRLEKQVGAWQRPSFSELGLRGWGAAPPPWPSPQKPLRRNLGSHPPKDASPRLPSPLAPTLLLPGLAVSRLPPSPWLRLLQLARSSRISRSQGRGRAAGLISRPIEPNSSKPVLWLHTAHSSPSCSPGGLTSD